MATLTDGTYTWEGIDLSDAQSAELKHLTSKIKERVDKEYKVLGLKGYCENVYTGGLAFCNDLLGFHAVLWVPCAIGSIEMDIEKHILGEYVVEAMEFEESIVDLLRFLKEYNVK